MSQFQKTEKEPGKLLSYLEKLLWFLREDYLRKWDTIIPFRNARQLGQEYSLEKHHSFWIKRLQQSQTKRCTKYQRSGHRTIAKLRSSNSSRQVRGTFLSSTKV